MQRSIILLSVFVLSASPLMGQTYEELSNKIAQLDSSFFISFNNCNLQTYESFLSEDYEFYHDKQTSKSVTKAKFTTLWKFEDDEWKVTRTFSYDHQPEPEYKIPEKELTIFEGNYQASDRIINIRNEGTILRMTDLVDNKEVWNAELLPESENLFYLNFENIQVEFITTGTHVEKLVAYENGTQIEESMRIK